MLYNYPLYKGEVIDGGRSARCGVRGARGSHAARDPRAPHPGEATVAELAAPFRVSQPAISRHLKVLERAGLISRTRRATARLSHLRAEPLRQATVWLAGYRRYWEQSYERLDELLAALQEQETDRSQPTGDPTGRSTT